MQDDDPSVRSMAIKKSSLTKDRRFYQALFQAVNDPDTVVRLAVIERFINDLHSIAFQWHERTDSDILSQIRLKLMQLLHDDTEDVRQEAVKALAGFRDASIISDLVSQFENESAQVKIAIINTIHAITALPENAISISLSEVVPKKKAVMNEQLLALLQCSVSDPSPEIRATSIRLIGFADSPVVYPILQNALRDSDPGIRVAAIDGLVGIGGEHAISSLCAATGDADDEVRYWAFAALQHFHTPEVIPALRSGLLDKSFAIRLMAFKAAVFCVFSERKYGHYDYDDDLTILPTNTGAVLGRYWSEIGLLIDAIIQGHEHGALAVIALAAITGENYGDDNTGWQHWYEERDATYRPPIGISLESLLHQIEYE